MTPTISLMQDQVHKLNSIGISSVFLGSAQLDKQVEVQALQPESKDLVVFVTPEWISKPVNQSRIHSLVECNKLALIAIDETHLLTEWRKAFNELKWLKTEFPTVPLMALTVADPGFYIGSLYNNERALACVKFFKTTPIFR